MISLGGIILKIISVTRLPNLIGKRDNRKPKGGVMKKILITAVAALAALTFLSSQAFAISSQYQRKRTPTQDVEAKEQKMDKEYDKEEKQKVRADDFPENGWHKGPYIAVHGGMMQATNDTNIQTNVKFDGTWIPSFGLTFGWDINDWLGPMLQLTYGTATSTVGNGTVNYPIESARQHALNFSLFCRAIIPYFVRAKWQPKSVKILPYVKLGGTGHGLFVNSNSNGNKVGGFGGGVGVGAGVEFFVWKGFFFAIDLTENLIFQKALYQTVGGVNTKLTDGGFQAQFNLLGLIGWHF